MIQKEWPLWEVFIRSRQGLNHKHVGSLHAVDFDMAIENARDVYTRRMEGVSIWVIESNKLNASEPKDNDVLFESSHDKIYKHPTFSSLPEELNHTLWEVFIQSKQGLNFKHVGSLHAEDVDMAIETAREGYTRSMEGVSIWVVQSNEIHANEPNEQDALFEPANDKTYRHPTFYILPVELNHM
jgi:ring-1,2-phenylacetyl-CoA epoxidase subunit PaaB